ncbi:MAG: MFS transporter [Candidatus Aenigmarchaeota archaeon]|nr:MFS transporter [Candidatus Aenigmarchaeota archaeon]
MRRELKILLSAAGLFIVAGGLFGPIYAVFVEKIGGDLLTAGSAYGLYSISAGFLIFLISKWEDHVKHQEKLVVLGYLLSTIGFLGYLLIRTPIHLFIVQIILGLGEAVGTPAYDGLYSKYLDKGKFVSEWGLWESMHYILTAIAAVIGGFLANMLGFKILFIFMFFLSLSGLIISSLLVFDKFYIK